MKVIRRSLLCILLCLAIASPVDAAKKKAKKTIKWMMFQGDGVSFVLTEPLPYLIESTGEMITVPAGFVTDFASVPAAARAIIDTKGKHSMAAVVHDYLYWDQSCSRLQADLILHEAMMEYGSSWFDKNAVYYAVRVGAGSAWDGNLSERKRGLPRIVPENYLEQIPDDAIWEKYRQFLFSKGVRAEPIPSTPTQSPAYCELAKS